MFVMHLVYHIFESASSKIIITTYYMLELLMFSNLSMIYLNDSHDRLYFCMNNSWLPSMYMTKTNASPHWTFITLLKFEP